MAPVLFPIGVNLLCAPVAILRCRRTVARPGRNKSKGQSVPTGAGSTGSKLTLTSNRLRPCYENLSFGRHNSGAGRFRKPFAGIGAGTKTFRRKYLVRHVAASRHESRHGQSALRAEIPLRRPPSPVGRAMGTRPINVPQPARCQCAGRLPASPLRPISYAGEAATRTRRSWPSCAPSEAGGAVHRICALCPAVGLARPRPPEHQCAGAACRLYRSARTQSPLHGRSKLFKGQGFGA